MNCVDLVLSARNLNNSSFTGIGVGGNPLFTQSAVIDSRSVEERD